MGGQLDANICGDCRCPAERHADLSHWLLGLYQRRVDVLEGPAFGGGRAPARATMDREADQRNMHLGGGIFVPDPLFCGIPLVAYTQWDLAEARLLVHSHSQFNPRGDGRRPNEGLEPVLELSGSPRDVAAMALDNPSQLLVSVICPTTAERSAFHPSLYELFCRQTHPRKELVVVETSFQPSGFFADIAKRDSQVVYRHFRAQDTSWPVGLKRNIACYLARGEVIVHMDDDDLYASGYIERMLGAVLKGVRKAVDQEPPYVWEHHWSPGELPPAIATLAAWHVLNLSDVSFGYLDAQFDPAVAGMRRSWMYGWGFSHAYTRSAWQMEPFPEVTQCEDVEFIKALMNLGVPVELPREDPGQGLCAHTYHAANCSGGEFRDGKRLGVHVDPPPALADCLPVLLAATSRGS